MNSKYYHRIVKIFTLSSLALLALPSYGESHFPKSGETAMSDENAPTNEELSLAAIRVARHQYAANITMGLGLLAAGTAMIAGAKAANERDENGGSSKSDAKLYGTHAGIAAVAFGSYLWTAYLGLSSPRLPKNSVGPSIKWHKRLALIHIPAMIVGPILGLIAYQKVSKGEEVTGPAKYHLPVMYTGVAALTAAWTVMTF